MHNENWDDLRFVLAVAESGSVLQAATHLGVNHATVLRRVASFEDRHGVSLFERTSRGYRLLPDCAHIIRAAQLAESAIAEVGRVAGGGQQTVRGTVRVTSTDTLCTVMLPKFVAAMQKKQPHLVISLISSNSYLDLLQEPKTLTVRPSIDLPNNMIGERSADLAFAPYARDETQVEWLMMSGAISRSIAAKWVSENKVLKKSSIAADSFLTLRELAALGQGIAVLPCFIGDPDPRLRRLESRAPRIAVPLWVARHADAVQTQHMHTVQSELLAFFSKQFDLEPS